MLSSDNFFNFDVKRVCSTLLLMAFRFTRAMYHSVLTLMETASSSGQINSSMEGPESVSMAEQLDDNFSPSGDSIVSFIERFYESSADKIPDRTEWNLPF